MRKYDQTRFNFILEAIKFIEEATAKTITLKSTYAIFLNLVTLAEAACKIGLEDTKHGEDMYKAIPWGSLQKIRGLVHQVHLFNLSELSAEVIQEIPKFTQLKNITQFILENEADPDASLSVNVLLNNFLNKVETEKTTRDNSHALKRTDNDIMLTIQQELENIQNFLDDDPNWENEGTFYAIEMAFAIIANQIKEDNVNGTGLSVEFMKTYPLNAPMEGVNPQLLSTWSRLIELGNEYIHNYYNIDQKNLITTCQIEFPIVRKRVQTICNDIQLPLQPSTPVVAESTYSSILNTLSETSEIQSSPQHFFETKEEIKEISKVPDDLLEQLEEEYQSDTEQSYRIQGKN